MPRKPRPNAPPSEGPSSRSSTKRPLTGIGGIGLWLAEAEAEASIPIRSTLPPSPPLSALGAAAAAGAPTAPIARASRSAALSIIPGPLGIGGIGPPPPPPPPPSMASRSVPLGGGPVDGGAPAAFPSMPMISNRPPPPLFSASSSPPMPSEAMMLPPGMGGVPGGGAAGAPYCPMLEPPPMPGGPPRTPPGAGDPNAPPLLPPPAPAPAGGPKGLAMPPTYAGPKMPPPSREDNDWCEPPAEEFRSGIPVGVAAPLPPSKNPPPPPPAPARAKRSSMAAEERECGGLPRPPLPPVLDASKNPSSPPPVRRAPQMLARRVIRRRLTKETRDESVSMTCLGKRYASECLGKYWLPRRRVMGSRLTQNTRVKACG